MKTNNKNEKVLDKGSMNEGFTIIESLVAIVILIFVIVGATSAIQTGISSYIFSKDQVAAFYLAQEGFEHVRNLRDENGLKSQNWLTGLAANSSDPCYFGNACYIDAITGLPFVRCASVGNCPRIRQNSSNGFYGYNGSWTQTPYTREIQLQQVSATEVSVIVKVSWSKGVMSRQFQIRGNIYDW